MGKKFGTFHAMSSLNLPPVPCPKCGERQNVSNGASDPDGATFDLSCMVCGHAFTRVEFKMEIAVVLQEPPKGMAKDAAARLRAGNKNPRDV